MGIFSKGGRHLGGRDEREHRGGYSPETEPEDMNGIEPGIKEDYDSGFELRAEAAAEPKYEAEYAPVSDEKATAWEETAVNSTAAEPEDEAVPEENDSTSAPKAEMPKNILGAEKAYARAYGERNFSAVDIMKLAISAVLFVLGFLNIFPIYLKMVFFALSFAIAGYDSAIDGVKYVINNKMPDENILVILAGICAFPINRAADGAALMLIFKIGGIIQDKLVKNSYEAIDEKLVPNPQTVNVRAANGDVIIMRSEKVQPGQLMIIKQGEALPLDGIVEEGTSSADVSSVTGSGSPTTAVPGVSLPAGSVNLGKTIAVRAEKTYKKSAAYKITKAVGEAGSQPSGPESFAVKFFRLYMTAAFVIALVIGLILPLALKLRFAEMLPRALSFMVAACPCAYIVSIPLAIFSGIARASKAGIVFKKSGTVLDMAKAGTVVVNPSGIITTGKIHVSSAEPAEGVSIDELLILAAYAGAYSTDPLARSLVSEDRKLDLRRVVKSREIPGEGVLVMLSNKQIIEAGSHDFMVKLKIGVPMDNSGLRQLYVAVGQRYAGRVFFEEGARSGIRKDVATLRESGIDRVVIVTDAGEGAARKIASDTGIEKVFPNCDAGLREDRVRSMQKSMRGGRTLIYAAKSGDDAPALSAADIGVVLGGIDGDLPAADAVILDDSIGKLSHGIAEGENVRRTIKQNALFVLGIKLVMIILALTGIAPLWLTMFAGVGAGIVPVLNSARSLNEGEKKK